MSAWLVSKRHIDAIVTGLINARLIGGTVEAADAAGFLLWQENNISVSHRYREPLDDLLYCWQANEVDAWTLLKAIDCLDYQSCEHDGWPTSDAFALLDRLAAVTLAKLNAGVLTYKDSKEWSAAPWGLE
jgi:hypothetical protein